MLKVITGQNDTAANVIPQNKIQINTKLTENCITMHKRKTFYVLTIKTDKTNVSSTHMEQNNI